jgi:hypothetical protein
MPPARSASHSAASAAISPSRLEGTDSPHAGIPEARRIVDPVDDALLTSPWPDDLDPASVPFRKRSVTLRSRIGLINNRTNINSVTAGVVWIWCHPGVRLSLQSGDALPPNPQTPAYALPLAKPLPCPGFRTSTGVCTTTAEPHGRRSPDLWDGHETGILGPAIHQEHSRGPAR